MYKLGRNHITQYCKKGTISEIPKLGENGRKAYEKKYNWKIMEEQLLGLYDKLRGDK